MTGQQFADLCTGIIIASVSTLVVAGLLYVGYCAILARRKQRAK